MRSSVNHTDQAAKAGWDKTPENLDASPVSFSLNVTGSTGTF